MWLPAAAGSRRRRGRQEQGHFCTAIVSLRGCTLSILRKQYDFDTKKGWFVLNLISLRSQTSPNHPSIKIDLTYAGTSIRFAQAGINFLSFEVGPKEVSASCGLGYNPSKSLAKYPLMPTFGSTVS